MSSKSNNTNKENSLDSPSTNKKISNFEKHLTHSYEIDPQLDHNNETDNDYQDHDDNDWELTRDPPKEGWKRNLPEYFFSNSEHAKFIRKLDILVFGYSLLSSFISTLDNSNIQNAYVSGMQKDLKLYGNELNLFQTFYSCGIIAGSVPLIFISTYIRPSIILPTCELLWSIFVMCCAGASNAKTIYGLRFLIGCALSIGFPGFTALISSWYLPNELGKRIVFYEISGNVAAMFSGYIQAGLYSNMDGKHGLAAWRWLFIFDGVISIFVVILGYIIIPDTPTTTRSRFLNSKEKKYAIKRMELAGRKPITKANWQMIKQSLSTWHLYGFVMSFYLYGTFSWGGNYFNLWLQSLNKYTVQQLNQIPTASQGAAIINSFISSILSDYFRHRPIIIIINMIICMMGNAFIAPWKSPEGLKFVGYILINVGWPGQSLLMAWANEICQGNPLTRSMIVAVGNTFVNATNAWLQVLLFPASTAPHYKAGYHVCAAFIGLAVVSIAVCWALLQRDYKKGYAIKSKVGLPIYPQWEEVFNNVNHEKNN
ncbi:putative transporter SEO1 [Wickerhamomyces ciferrii]|uniref:Transporter SEO1 n=1 Tax=Wickerhamomyces ciferrii (strain ATCC 14091 / BCRC 22168 / CBS 111 / JCM 3599 / NBRC 0793 / NRRL Y-1031 F-60-10) TaxID=1206466 RepID=K0KW94_WICCF|nr:putative transporter SEO1 [Wickerhamomyces ciferrii]CCH46242.1 putative transporter SEO1 [Wickerhamomyces ciferrii]